VLGCLGYGVNYIVILNVDDFGFVGVGCLCGIMWLLFGILLCVYCFGWDIGCLFVS